MAFGGVNRNAEKPFFDGVEIQRVKSVKYLGITINERMSNIDHLTKRKQGTMARLKDIEEIFGQNIILPHLKIFLYKAYARPILFYGLEAIKLNKTEINNIQTIESSIVKYQLGLRKQSKSSELLYALDIEKSELRLQELKCSFYMRLMRNNYTQKVIQSIENYYNATNDAQISEKSVIKEVSDILFDTNPNVDIITRCKGKISDIVNKIKAMGENDLVKKIKEALTKCDYFDELTCLTYVTFAQVN